MQEKKQIEIPSKLESLECSGGCGKLLEPIYLSPIFFMDRLIAGSNVWQPVTICEGCQVKEEAERSAIRAIEIEKEKAERILQFFKLANIPKIFADADFSAINGESFNALKDFMPGFLLDKTNLFIYGKCGVGKTWPAVALLKEYISRNGCRGYFQSIPNFCDELRVAIKKHQSEELLDELCQFQVLVLDDFGVERPTEYVVERLYMLFNRWYESMEGGLIVTSNRPLDEISQRLDDRIVSRIYSMCKIVEVKGQDRRTK